MNTPPAAMYVGYARVSTDQQGRSGLGIDAQKAAIGAHLRPGDRLLSLHVEVESGRVNDRPKLAEAMARCRTTGAVLLIAKLDRLSRDAHFLLGLQKADVDFVACDMPTASRLTVGIMAMVAEEEARMISARTKAALAAAKARGTKLGGDRGNRPATAESVKKGATASAIARQRNANHAAHRIAPRIAELQAAGVSLAGIAKTLNEEGAPTARRGAWTATAVRRVVERVEGRLGGPRPDG